MRRPRNNEILEANRRITEARDILYPNTVVSPSTGLQLAVNMAFDILEWGTCEPPGKGVQSDSA